MKKIIATVLAMVMALALCSTAFAATDTWGLYVGTDKNPTEKVDALIKHEDGKDIVNSVDGNVEYWQVDYVSYFVTCDKDEATHTMYRNNGYYAYVKLVTNEAATKYSVVVTEQDKTTEKASCTVDHYLKDGYLDEDGNFYVEGNGITAKISGTQKLVSLNLVSKSDSSNVIYASHVLGKATKNSDKGWDEATCLVCGAKVALTSEKNVLKKNSIKIDDTYDYCDADARAVIVDNDKTGKYAFAVGTEFAGDYDYAWDLTSGSSSTDTTTDKTSPKTFDAGVAMYVGMALASVTGSAVVIGKKKEF